MTRGYIKLICCISIIVLSSCRAVDYELQKSIFVEDKTNPGLPEYSEWGYNTFGAYIDRVKFISEYQTLPAKIIVNQDTLNIILNGVHQGTATSLHFKIKGYSPKDYPDLTALNGVKVNLKSNDVTIKLIQGKTTTMLNVIDGELYFKRVQLLYVDKQKLQSILSGTFAFKTFKNSEPIAVSNGRFDFGIGYDNFYNY